MSQNVIRLDTPSGHEIEVRVGFDRPIGKVFSNVVPAEADTTSYSKINMRWYSDVGKLAAAFFEAGIPLPESVLAEVEKDLANEVGNVIKEFDHAGNIVRVEAW